MWYTLNIHQVFKKINLLFYPHQKLLYEAVLDIQLQLIENLSGSNAAEHQSVDKLYRSMLTILGERLVDLGIISHEVARYHSYIT